MHIVKRAFFLCLKTAIFCGAFYGVAKFCKKETGGFTLTNISSDLAFHPEWEVASNLDKKELERIFRQPFSYLAKGLQCYVFASQDGKYVLKFFKQNQHARLPWIIDKAPLPSTWASIRDQKREIKSKRVAKEFASYKLAYEELQEETGVVYLHLNKSSDLHVKGTLIDKLNIAHSIDLDDYCFILQKKAELLLPYMQKLDNNERKEALSSLFDLFRKNKEKGIVNLDPNLLKNFGFIEGKAVQLDIGRFTKNTDRSLEFLFTRREKNDRFKKWLEEQDPSLAVLYDEECKKCF